MAFYMSRIPLGYELRRLGCKSMRCFDADCRSFSSTSTALFPRSTLDNANKEAGKLGRRESKNVHVSESVNKPDLNIRFKYPEMFPEPYMLWRNPIKEKLERKDMLARRSCLSIPEFYVGSVLRVNLSNIHQPDKTSSFVGICIMREETGLRASFTLRNVIDNLGVEIKLELYDPRLLKIEVLRLERRLDPHLRYLRDAPPEYSTFPLDMKPDINRSDEVPLNRIKVKLNPRPWTEYWHKIEYKGIDESIDDLITNKWKARREKLRKPWEKYDLMKTYRATLPEEEMEEILSEIKEDVEEHDRKHSRRQS